MLARSKSKIIESKTSEALRNGEVSHEGFITIINKEKIYRELKKRIRRIINQRSDMKKSI